MHTGNGIRALGCKKINAVLAQGRPLCWCCESCDFDFSQTYGERGSGYIECRHAGTPAWAFRHGPEPPADNKFGLGEVLDTGAMLLGRRTWLFGTIWPGEVSSTTGPSWADMSERLPSPIILFIELRLLGITTTEHASPLRRDRG